MRWDVARGLVVWIVLSLVGVVIVLLPDDGERLFSLTEEHGPSLQDTIGVFVLLVGWVAFLVPLYRRRSSIERRWALGSLALVGGAELVWSLATDSGSWWLVGAAILAGVQLIAAATVIRKHRLALGG